jgi:glycosyltransferase involved in cell wall biosynthesis
MRKKRILYIVAHRLGRSPGQRFRFEQYLDYLSQNGFEYEISNFLDEKDDKTFYSDGKYLQKLWIMLKSIKHRFNDVRRASEFDIVFIYRDAIMIGWTYFEKRFHASKAKVIYDFDDAIWYNDTSKGNINLEWLKKPSKINTIIRLSDIIFAGNAYLADYAKQFNDNVKVIPTTIDTDYYIKSQIPNPKFQINSKFEKQICIGWTGSQTTLKHLQLAIPFLKKLKDKYGDRIRFKIIADVPIKSELIDLEFCKWKKDTEIEDLSEIDIGIMPLPDNKWTKGKCGFKGLQYMALEIPAVVSPVGVNNEIIDEGINGFLPKTDDEWTSILSSLIESEELRERIGKNGRKTVIERYSVLSLKDKYLNYFNELIDE